MEQEAKQVIDILDEQQAKVIASPPRSVPTSAVEFANHIAQFVEQRQIKATFDEDDIRIPVIHATVFGKGRHDIYLDTVILLRRKFHNQDLDILGVDEMYAVITLPEACQLIVDTAELTQTAIRGKTRCAAHVNLRELKELTENECLTGIQRSLVSLDGKMWRA